MNLLKNKKLRKAARLDQLVFVVTLLWLATTFAVLFLYRTENSHATDPGRVTHSRTAQAARASFIY